MSGGAFNFFYARLEDQPHRVVAGADELDAMLDHIETFKGRLSDSGVDVSVLVERIKRFKAEVKEAERYLEGLQDFEQSCTDHWELMKALEWWASGDSTPARVKTALEEMPGGEHDRS